MCGMDPILQLPEFFLLVIVRLPRECDMDGRPGRNEHFQCVDQEVLPLLRRLEAGYVDELNPGPLCQRGIYFAARPAYCRSYNFSVGIFTVFRRDVALFVRNDSAG